MRTRLLVLGSAAGLSAGCWLFASIDELSPRTDAGVSDAAAVVDAEDGQSSVDGAGCAPLQISPDGGAVAILSDLSNPVAVAVDPAPCGAGLLFWMNGDACGYDDGGLYVADKNGGSHRLLVAGSICNVVTSASHVAWAGYGYVGTARIDGSNQGMATTGSVYHIAISDNVIYWAGSYTPEVFRSVADGVVCTNCLFTTAASGVFSVAANKSSVYWTELGNEDENPSFASTAAVRVLEDGRTRTIDEGPEMPHSLVLGSERIYWIADGLLRSAPRDGGTAVQLVRDARPNRLVIAGERLYWTEDAGTVQSCDLEGRDTRVHATGQDGPMGIAADDTAVYWANRGSGTIMRLPLSR